MAKKRVIKHIIFLNSLEVTEFKDVSEKNSQEDMENSMVYVIMNMFGAGYVENLINALADRLKLNRGHVREEFWKLIYDIEEGRFSSIPGKKVD